MEDHDRARGAFRRTLVRFSLYAAFTGAVTLGGTMILERLDAKPSRALPSFMTNGNGVYACVALSAGAALWASRLGPRRDDSDSPRP